MRGAIKLQPCSTCAEGVQFYCPSHTYAAIPYCTIFLIFVHGEIGKVLGERDPLHLISLYYVGIFYTEIFMRTVDLCFFFH